MRYEQIQKEVNPEKYYSALEIAKNGWITPIKKGDKAKFKYDYILKLIKNKKIPAKNIGSGKVVGRYYIRGIDILDWAKIFI